ncbi:SurA N-terminal domain-containing protein [Devosia sp. PTR5]|uniref:SurA N-terminal domain-containing protein n=1 Tax=Devosia oryzisoli TaxID=2774138 RepID=A0A927FRD3_9HYPH|nr:peptidylprolyl isomerase [Devosia oryzisoli]MBD8064616.1 SurA N-terminal domain-containing protein [Devosia oryzisoli]
MLDGLRDFAKSWPGKILGGFMLVGIAGFGINNVITDLGSSTVARVGSEEINSREFMRAYQSLVNRVAQQTGSVPTVSEAEAMGLPTAVLLNLSSNASLDLLADQFNLGVSEDKLSQMLRQDPSFQGTLGNFDPSIFSQVLQQSGWTESEYFQARSKEAKRQQLQETLLAGAGLPKVADELLNGYVGTKRTINYITLGPLNVDTPAEPTEEEMAAYLQQHQAEYRTVETRRVQMVELSVATLANTLVDDFTDAEIEAEYERTKASLSTPERRTIDQVVLSTPEIEQAFQDGLAAGTPFDQLVSQTNVTPTDLGTLARSEVTDTALADAAFGLEAGAFTIIDGVGGRRAVRVSAVQPAHQSTLADARDDIAMSLATAKARNEVNDVLDQIEELRAAFRPLTEIAERFGLDLYEADVTAGGSELSVVPSLTPQDQQTISQAIFKAEEEKLTPAVRISNNANLWFDLVEVQPARDQTLEEVRPAIQQAMTDQRTSQALEALSKDLVSRLDKGETIEEIAASLNVFPQISTPFTRFGSEDGTVDQVVASAVFSGGPQANGSVVNSTGDTIVYSVAETTPPSDPLNQQALDSIDAEARQGVASEFIGALRDDAQLRINQQALNTLLTTNFGQ